MYYPKHIVSNQKREYISIQGVNAELKLSCIVKHISWVPTVIYRSVSLSVADADMI